jgi:hypothetical protein
MLSQYINVTGWGLGIMPTLVIFYFIWMNRGEPWRISNFVSALLLIATSAFMLGLFTDIIAMLEDFHEREKIADGVFKELKTSGVIWLATIPAVAGGVGINILSTFLSSRKP